MSGFPSPLRILQFATLVSRQLKFFPKRCPTASMSFRRSVLPWPLPVAPPRFTGAGDLRHKESDRLAATAALLRGAGADFQEHPDGLVVHGNPDFRPISATYASLHDHRIAMSAAILAGRGKGKSGVKDASCTAISYPSFWDDLSVLSVL